jgi:hypothetical protein
MPAQTGTDTWSADELERIGAAQELQLASRRADLTLGRYVTMWVVRADDDIYVRSAYGPDNGWYRRAIASGAGRIRAGGVEQDVVFVETSPATQDAIDAAYHAKYDSYGPTIVGHVTGSHSHGVTVRLAKAATEKEHR